MKSKILLFTALLALGITACGGKPSSQEQPKSEEPAPSSEVQPASSETQPTTSEQAPVSSEQSPASSEQGPASSQQTPASSEQGPASSQPAESSIPPEDLPQNYELCTMVGYENGGEAIKGKLVYWFGEGGNLNVSEGTGEDKEYLIFDYTPGWQWYSGQIFVATPYAEAGDSLKVEFDVIPSAAGVITVNGNLFNLQANQTNHISYKVTVTDNLRAIDLQFGKNDGNVIYPASTFKFTQPTIKPYNGVYHKVSFGMMTGTTYSEALSYYVKDGKALFYVLDYSSFASFLPPEMVVKGWKDSNGQYATTSTVITADTQYTLEIVSQSSIVKRTVTYKVGTEVIHTDEVNDGTATSAPTFAWNEIGFGYAAVGFYDDAGLNQAHDFTNVVSSDQVIYVKRALSPSVWMNWPTAPEATFVATDSKYTITGLNCGKAPGNQSWEVQVNFPNVPAENGVSYTLSFKYKLTAAANGNVQLWENDSNYLALGALVADGAEHAVTKTYNGGDYASINSFGKLTFELGQCDNNTGIEIYDLSLIAA